MILNFVTVSLCGHISLPLICGQISLPLMYGHIPWRFGCLLIYFEFHCNISAILIWLGFLLTSKKKTMFSYCLFSYLWKPVFSWPRKESMLFPWKVNSVSFPLISKSIYNETELSCWKTLPAGNGFTKRKYWHFNADICLREYSSSVVFYYLFVFGICAKFVIFF